MMKSIQPGNWERYWGGEMEMEMEMDVDKWMRREKLLGKRGGLAGVDIRG